MLGHTVFITHHSYSYRYWHAGSYVYLFMVVNQAHAWFPKIIYVWMPECVSVCVRPQRY